MRKGFETTSIRPGGKVHIGLDIGSISVNTVVIDSERRVLENYYDYCHGRPFHVLRAVLTRLLSHLPVEAIGLVGLTGTGGKLASQLIGGSFVNEIVAQSSSVAKLYPEARTVIEMGGEDSKLIFLEHSRVTGATRLSDFAMNSVCAAGTGSFLDQQARRINVNIEGEFGELALKSEDPPRIAGRCSVFAKSDMIHLQQIATPVHDIVAGLCFAVARNLKSNLARGKELSRPVVFQGGVAANAGMVRAFREVLGLAPGELIIPTYHASMGAIGAVFHLLDSPEEPQEARGGFLGLAGLAALDAYVGGLAPDGDHLAPLRAPTMAFDKDVFPLPPAGTTDVALGLDVGSLSTNVVLIDGQNRVVARRYLPTAGKPLDAIRRGLAEITEEVGDRVVVRAVGTTGSGRYLTGDFVGADVIQNEITAQATAAIAHRPRRRHDLRDRRPGLEVHQPRDGVIVDFEMNKVCAAGTGSFLEEQAEKLGINIIEEFAKLALRVRRRRAGRALHGLHGVRPDSHQQKGASKEDLVAGLAYSIVHNYLYQRRGRPEDRRPIFFQGGVAFNRAVGRGLRAVTGKPITVPPHFDCTGAIGAAMLARDAMRPGQRTRFKGFQVSRIPYRVDTFACKHCANQCDIRRVEDQGRTGPFYGGRCERYEVDERRKRGTDTPNLFEDRLRLLEGDYHEEPPDGRVTIGLPRGLSLLPGVPLLACVLFEPRLAGSRLEEDRPAPGHSFPRMPYGRDLLPRRGDARPRL